MLFLRSVGTLERPGTDNVPTFQQSLKYWFFYKIEMLPSFSSFLGHKIEGERWICAISGLIIIVSLGSYAAAQLVAGSKALNAVFGCNYNNLGAIAP